MIRRSLKHLMVVIPGAHADEHSCATAHQFVRRLACVLNRFPDNLQQDSLLGVHTDGLAWCDAKKPGVELVDLLQKAPPAADHFAGGLTVRIKKSVDVPALRRHF